MDHLHALEAILFASGDPISVDRLAEVLEIEREDVIDLAEALELHYKKIGSGICIVRLAGLDGNGRASASFQSRGRAHKHPIEPRPSVELQDAYPARAACM